MSRVLIIGCGNPLRCDDGLAWRAADELSRLALWDVEIIAQHQLTPELAFPVSHADMVLFIDAAQGGTPGELRCESVSPGPASHSLSHEFSPAAILHLTRELYGKAPPAFLLSLCGECFAHGEALSPKVKESLPCMVKLVTDLITQPEVVGEALHG